MVRARMRWAMRTASPAGVLARWRSSRICPLRLAKTLSITSREEASARSRPRLAAVPVSRSASGSYSFSLPGHDRVAERQPPLVGQKDESHAPDEAVMRLRVAVAGEAGERGSLLAARIAGDR